MPTMTQAELVALRDKVRAKKPAKYTIILDVCKGNDGNYYYNNQTFFAMPSKRREYWTWQEQKTYDFFTQDSREIRVGATRYICSSELETDELSYAVNLYDWSKRNGRIRVYRLD